MMSAVQSASVQQRPRGRFLSARAIEQMIEWAEPIVSRVCQEVWREMRPQGLQLADLKQEGRIAVFEAAQQIASAQSPRAMAKIVIRRRAYNALRDLADCDPSLPSHTPAVGSPQDAAAG